jgi:hypothetical protein
VTELFSPHDDTERLDRLVDELRLTPALTPHLISRVASDVCTRVSGMARADRAARLDRLVRAEAWIDAVLALIELESPMWRPCRLIYDGGEWVCSLSRHPEIPFEFDDTADGRHEVQAIAILLSFVEAKRLLATSEHFSAPSVPQVAPAPAAYTFCCDNFG